MKVQEMTVSESRDWSCWTQWPGLDANNAVKNLLILGEIFYVEILKLSDFLQENVTCEIIWFRNMWKQIMIAVSSYFFNAKYCRKTISVLFIRQLKPELTRWFNGEGKKEAVFSLVNNRWCGRCYSFHPQQLVKCSLIHGLPKSGVLFKMLLYFP